MRTFFRTISLLILGSVLFLDTTAVASAADLALERATTRAVRVVHHHRNRVVFDLDGSAAIIVRPAPPVVLSSLDGTNVVRPLYENIPVLRGSPTHYLNGEPVLPPYPRSWPRQLIAPY